MRMNRDDTLVYCFDLAGQLLGKLDTMPDELETAIQDCHPKYALWTHELRLIASELYMLLPDAEASHMQQAYAAKLEEHRAYIANERGER